MLTKGATKFGPPLFASSAFPKTTVFGTLETPFRQVVESDGCGGSRGRVLGTQRNSLLREVHAAEEGLEALLHGAGDGVGGSAADEGELHRADLHRATGQLAFAEQDGILQSGFFAAFRRWS